MTHFSGDNHEFAHQRSKPLIFRAETTQGTINFHEWIGDGWAILFSHPKDFTPVCTTELGYMAGLQPEFAKRNCKIIGLSVDPVSSHGKWAVDIEETQGHKVNYPMIGDPELKVAKLYDMLPADAGTTSEGRTAATNATVRTVFVIGPDKKIKLMLVYPMSTGRNFDEVLRVLDSIQLTADAQGCNAGELEARRRCDHPAVGFGGGSQTEISWRLEDAQALPADRSPAEGIGGRTGRKPRSRCFRQPEGTVACRFSLSGISTIRIAAPPPIRIVARIC